MPMYALATLPLISQLGVSEDLVQVWYADDAVAAGSLESLRKWWDYLTTQGPTFGYFAMPEKHDSYLSLRG